MGLEVVREALKQFNQATLEKAPFFWVRVIVDIDNKASAGLAKNALNVAPVDIEDGITDKASLLFERRYPS